jgi:hypothetical protein
MNSRKSFLTQFVVLLICSVFATGSVFAQDADEEGSNQKTKQAQAVSKEVYDRIQKAQEMIDAEDQQGALKLLNAIKTKKVLLNTSCRTFSITLDLFITTLRTSMRQWPHTKR